MTENDRTHLEQWAAQQRAFDEADARRAAHAEGRVTLAELTEAARADFHIQLAAPPVVHEPVDRVGVHVTHCCWKHGCKYGKQACPVVLNLAEQEYPCEHCGATIALRPLADDASGDDLIHRLRELVVAFDARDSDGYADDLAEDFARTFDQLDRQLSTHGSALPGAWASPEGETP
jgi:hypothetical protein